MKMDPFGSVLRRPLFPSSDWSTNKKKFLKNNLELDSDSEMVEVDLTERSALIGWLVLQSEMWVRLLCSEYCLVELVSISGLLIGWNYLTLNYSLTLKTKMVSKPVSLSHSDWSIEGVYYLVVADLVPVGSVQIQAGTVSVQVMEQVAPDPSIEIVVMTTVAAAAVVVDPDSLDPWELDLDLTSSQTCLAHWMPSQESYLKRVHPNPHLVLVPVQNLNVAVQIVAVPFWVGFGLTLDDHLLDHLETRLVAL